MGDEKDVPTNGGLNRWLSRMKLSRSFMLNSACDVMTPFVSSNTDAISFRISCTTSGRTARSYNMPVAARVVVWIAAKVSRSCMSVKWPTSVIPCSVVFSTIHCSRSSGAGWPSFTSCRLFSTIGWRNSLIRRLCSWPRLTAGASFSFTTSDLMNLGHRLICAAPAVMSLVKSIAEAK